MSSSGCRGLGAAYIKGLPTASEEHICAETTGQRSGPRLLHQHDSFHSQAPTTSKVVDTPPTPYVKLILKIRQQNLASDWEFKERGRDVVAIESGGSVPEAAINNRRASSDDQASIRGRSHSEPRAVGGAHAKLLHVTPLVSSDPLTQPYFQASLSPDYLSLLPTSNHQQQKPPPRSKQYQETRWQTTRPASTISIVMEGTSRRSLLAAQRG